MSSTNGDSKDETFTKGVGKNPSVLGLTWVQSEDVLKFVIKLNFSPKKRGIRCESDLIRENQPHKIPTFITKRLVLSQVNGIYGPLGVITPFTVVAEILLRELWKRKLDWDEDVGEDDSANVIRFFTSAFELEDISFERCMKPKGSVGDSVFITFSVASTNAFGACSYFRWKLLDGTYKSTLIASKNRVAPLKMVSIVRLELCGAVLGKRLAYFIEEESKYNIKKEYFIVDSQVVRSMIRKRYSGPTGSCIAKILLVDPGILRQKIGVSVPNSIRDALVG